MTDTSGEYKKSSPKRRREEEENEKIVTSRPNKKKLTIRTGSSSSSMSNIVSKIEKLQEGLKDGDTCFEFVKSVENVLYSTNGDQKANANLAQELAFNGLLRILGQVLQEHFKRSDLVKSCTMVLSRMEALGVSTPLRGTSSSPYLGVIRLPGTKKWLAKFEVDESTTVNIGVFDSDVDAAKAYDKEAFLRYLGPLTPLGVHLNFGVPKEFTRKGGQIMFSPGQNMWLARFRRSEDEHEQDIPIGYFQTARDAEVGLGCAESVFEVSGFVGLRMCVEIAMEQLLKASSSKQQKIGSVSLLNEDIALLTRAKVISNASYTQLASNIISGKTSSECSHCNECAKRERMALSREQMALKLLHDALIREKHLVDAMNRTVSDLKKKCT